MTCCYNCFHEHNTAGPCPRCGYDPARDAGKFPQALPHGAILAGQFITGRVLGQGGFGITYLALDNRSGERVALKEFLPDTMAGRSSGSLAVAAYSGDRGAQFRYGLDCFLDEAKTLAKFIGNPSIVGVRSYFQENGTAYFTMDYIEGVSLKALLRQRGGRIGWEGAVRLLLPVMDALEAVHRENLVHRDVTPDNIYISNDGQVKLLDFGAARYSLGDRSRSLDVVLKPGYAPKEQYTRRGRQGPYTDVYSLGACFYAAITGAIPPEALDRMEEDDLVPPSARGCKLPETLEDAILKALEVQSQDRYQSMAEFRADLPLPELAPAPDPDPVPDPVPDPDPDPVPDPDPDPVPDPDPDPVPDPDPDPVPDPDPDPVPGPDPDPVPGPDPDPVPDPDPDPVPDPDPDPVPKPWPAVWKLAAAGAAAVLALALIIFGVARATRPSGVPTPPPTPKNGGQGDAVPVASPGLPTEEPFFLGNTNGNLNNGGFVAEHDGWIYYSAPFMRALVRAKGSETQTLAEDTTAMFINVTDEWVYYINGDDSSICRVRPDGSGSEVLAGPTEAIYQYFAVTEDCMYTLWMDSSLVWQLERRALDGGQPELLDMGTDLGCVALDGDGVYYQMDGGIWRMAHDGGSLLANDSLGMMDLADGWIYFNSMSRGCLCRMRTDGSGLEDIDISGQYYWVNCMNVHGGYICFMEETPDGGVRVGSFDGAREYYHLIEEEVQGVYIAGDWLYYLTDSGIYRVPLDGGEIEAVFAASSSNGPDSQEPDPMPEPPARSQDGYQKITYNGNDYEGDVKNGVPHGNGTMTYKTDSSDGGETYAKGDKYTGAWANGRREGQGTVWLASGTTYTGQWKNDLINGQGTESNVDGYTITGTFTSTRPNEFCNGQLTLTFENGWKYSGQFTDGDLQGQGTLTTPEGTRYSGNFKDSLFHGQGTMTWADGSKYAGEWKDGDRNGQGTYTWANGGYYKGEFKDGVQHGQGTEYYADGSVVFSGTWANGEPVRETAATVTDKPYTMVTSKFSVSGTYTGEWNNGKPHGKGTLTITQTDDRWDYGDTLWSADWVDGLIEGYGQWRSAVDGAYDGNFARGLKSGYGKMWFSDGTVYDGQWSEGDFTGWKFS